MLPSQVHPSYPYGNPNSLKHPSARPRPSLGTSSRALFEDMGYGGGGTNGTLRWTDLALQNLLPVDVEKEEAERAIQARKMASGTTTTNPQAPQAQPPAGQPNDEDDDGDDDNLDEDEDEDNGMYDEDGEEEDLDEEEG